MKLEDQVCSLELAKRIKEFGVKQESYFEWVNVNFALGKWEIFQVDEDDKVNTKVSAFTVAELGEMLPVGYKSFKQPHDGPIEWVCWDDTSEIKVPNFIAETEADARAEMLVYLLEKGIVKP